MTEKSHGNEKKMMQKNEMSNFRSQIPSFLQEATVLLSSWLTQTLPAISESWWSELVVPSLSFQQKERVERNRLDSIEQFDLAALLRILDRNWYFFVEKFPWEQQLRNYIKEVQTIRNKWAHTDSCMIAHDDAYRDCDTLERMLSSILGDNPLSSKIAEFKKRLIEQSNGDEPSNPVSTPVVAKHYEGIEAISPGSMITVKSCPGKIGVVVEKKAQSPENRYVVF